MNRRELLKTMTGAAATAGIAAGAVKAIEAEPPPLLLVIKTKECQEPEVLDRLRLSLHKLFARHGQKAPLIAVCGPDLDIDAVIARPARPHGRHVYRKVDTAWQWVEWKHLRPGDEVLMVDYDHGDLVGMKRVTSHLDHMTIAIEDCQRIL